MSFPSRGCQTCRDRRIKCDKNLPICLRCINSRRTCYGRRDQQVWHTENAYASRQTKRPRGPRPAKVDLTVSPIPTDLKSCALAYYMHNYSETPLGVPDFVKEVTGGCFPILPSAPWCSIIDLAISSVALATFSRAKRYPKAAIEATSTYAQLLQISQAELHCLNSRNLDTCLLAVFFMGRYEDSIYCPGSKIPLQLTLQSFSHHDGAMAILKVWIDRLRHNGPATNVIKHTRRGLIRSVLMRHAALPEWIQDGALFGEDGFELVYDRILVRVVNLRHRLVSLNMMVLPQPGIVGNTVEINEFNKDAQVLDEDLEHCVAQVPRPLNSLRRHRISELISWPTKDFYSPVVYSYSSLAYAAACCQYYATRMLVKSTRLRILALSSVSDMAQEQQLSFEMRYIGDDLAASTPFCLRRFGLTTQSHRNPINLNTDEYIKPIDARLIIWPLSIASSLDNMDISQKTWFQGQLSRLGKIVGFGVLESAEKDDWLVL
ncbi:hypothetical protein BDV25DRAFT_157798 [Aspergillus avenaceus]|uniref:Zn(2)-C6 fungal-type domain-containing protein n=1 Tax=Aspergillus avenaceus TaxID=36643 RepID=A0A5N6TQV4_ASPAV|nr:hypothetical protein BDV25DRAFT_157798 [Aspergillus avenaceus]